MLLFALYPCRNAKPREASTGCESNRRKRGMERRVQLLVGCRSNGIRPSTNGGRVTGLKGSPLSKKLALAEHRVQRHSLRRRHMEHVPPAAAAASRLRDIPRKHPVALLGPAGGGRVEGQMGGAGEKSLLGGRSRVLVVMLALGMVALVVVAGAGVGKDWVLEGLEGEAKVLAASARQEVRRVILKAHRRARRGCGGGCGGGGGAHGEEGFDGVGDSIGIERRREKTSTAAATAEAEGGRSNRFGNWNWFLARISDGLVGCDGSLGLLRIGGGRRVGGGGGGGGARVPGGKLGQLVDGSLGVFDEPVDGLAGTVVAEAVLDVVELDGGVGGEADAAVSGALGSAHFAVAVLAPGGAHNVASLDLHDLTSATQPSAEPRPLVLLLVAVVEGKVAVAVGLGHAVGETGIVGGGSRGRRRGGGRGREIEATSGW